MPAVNCERFSCMQEQFFIYNSLTLEGLELLLEFYKTYFSPKILPKVFKYNNLIELYVALLKKCVI